MCHVDRAVCSLSVSPQSQAKTPNQPPLSSPYRQLPRKLRIGKPSGGLPRTKGPRREGPQAPSANGSPASCNCTSSPDRSISSPDGSVNCVLSGPSAAVVSGMSIPERNACKFSSSAAREAARGGNSGRSSRGNQLTQFFFRFFFLIKRAYGRGLKRALIKGLKPQSQWIGRLKNRPACHRSAEQSPNP